MTVRSSAFIAAAALVALLTSTSCVCAEVDRDVFQVHAGSTWGTDLEYWALVAFGAGASIGLLQFAAAGGGTAGESLAVGAIGGVIGVVLGVLIGLVIAIATG